MQFRVEAREDGYKSVFIVPDASTNRLVGMLKRGDEISNEMALITDKATKLMTESMEMQDAVKVWVNSQTGVDGSPLSAHVLPDGTIHIVLGDPTGPFVSLD